MTLAECVARAEEQLRTGPHGERARRDAELLLLHVIGKTRSWLIAHSDRSLDANHAAPFSQLILRRQRGEPIQYITGEAEFYGLPFLVTPDVLIPRPETEHLVETVVELATTFDRSAAGRDLSRAKGNTGEAGVLQAAERLNRAADRGFIPGKAPIESARTLAPETNSLRLPPDNRPFSATPSAPPESGSRFPRIVDVGAGSGAIAVALAHQLPHAHITALDISLTALAIANQNAARNNVSGRICLLKSDLLTAVSNERFQMVVSNPPYVPLNDRESLAVEVRDHEPALALFAGEDGLDVYRRLIPEAFAVLDPCGFVVLEIGFGQAEALRALLAAAGFDRIHFQPDLRGIPRVAWAQRPA